MCPHRISCLIVQVLPLAISFIGMVLTGLSALNYLNVPMFRHVYFTHANSRREREEEREKRGAGRASNRIVIVWIGFCSLSLSRCNAYVFVGAIFSALRRVTTIVTMYCEWFILAMVPSFRIQLSVYGMVAGMRAPLPCVWVGSLCFCRRRCV